MADFLLGMYAAWTLPFFILMGVIFVGSIYDYNNHSIVFLILFSLAFVGFGIYSDSLQGTLDLSLQIPLYIVSYLLIGVLWSFLRIKLLVNKADSLYFEYVKTNSAESAARLVNQKLRRYGGFPLSVKGLKSYIRVSILYWPLGVLGYLFHDTLIEISSKLYIVLGNAYEGILKTRSSQYEIDKAKNSDKF